MIEKLRRAALTVAFASAVVFASATPAAATVKVLVIDGDEAANIVADKLATAPVVEVRDEDDRPRPGAIVRFVIKALRNSRGRGTFSNGTSEISVVTDSAGRAAAGPLTPVGTGPIEVEVQASYQGQTATTTIRQTNFATQAQAEQARNGQTNTSSSGQSAGQVGGLSRNAWIGIGAGAAGAAGLVAASALGGKGQPTPSSPTPAPTPTPAAPTPTPAATRAVLVITSVSPNPVPVSNPPQCSGNPGWTFTLTFTETAGVAATLTRASWTVDGNESPSQFIPGQATIVPARGSITRQAFDCADDPTRGHTVVITYFATDANGNEVSVRSPSITLLPRQGSTTSIVAPINHGGRRAQ